MRTKRIDNRYRIVKNLGCGSMGEVYKAHDLKNDRIVAIKILSKRATSSGTVHRFEREFSLLVQLQHPYLCSVYDFGLLHDGRSYFTMEYVDGKDIFTASRNVSYENIYTWIVQLCRVLEYIHSKGFIHYDIKPNNVLIAKSIEQRSKGNKKHYMHSPLFYAKLLDFGLAEEQQIQRGTLIRGTFPYIAPEVIKCSRVDHRADLYSLGVLLYEIFTRKRIRILKKARYTSILDWSLKPSRIFHDLPEGIKHMILKLVASEPSERYSYANEAIEAINRMSRTHYPLETGETLESYLLSSKFVGRDKEMNALRSI
jgi:serine/threonine protein kinase